MKQSEKLGINLLYPKEDRVCIFLIYLSDVFHCKSLSVNNKFFRVEIALADFFYIPSIRTVIELQSCFEFATRSNFPENHASFNCYFRGNRLEHINFG